MGAFSKIDMDNQYRDREDVRQSIVEYKKEQIISELSKLDSSKDYSDYGLLSSKKLREILNKQKYLLEEKKSLLNSGEEIEKNQGRK